MTEAETKELHRAIAERFEPDRVGPWRDRIGSDPHHASRDEIAGPLIYYPDYRHPVHWARLQELLNIGVEIDSPYVSTKWVSVHISTRDLVRGKKWPALAIGTSCRAVGPTQGQAIMACVAELLKYSKPTTKAAHRGAKAAVRRGKRHQEASE